MLPYPHLKICQCPTPKVMMTMTFSLAARSSLKALGILDLKLLHKAIVALHQMAPESCPGLRPASSSSPMVKKSGTCPTATTRL